MTILEWETFKGSHFRTAEICFLSSSNQVSSRIPSETTFSGKTFLATTVFSRIHSNQILDFKMLFKGFKEAKVCPRVSPAKL
jgi:hypothetical protein